MPGKTGRVALTFDDANANIFANAYPYMAANNIAGTAYVPTNDVGDAGKMSWANLQTLDGAGWSIGNHSMSHADLTALTQAQVEAELSGAATALSNNSLPNARLHVAYPSGLRNATTDAAMTATGMLTGRLASGSNFDFNTVNHQQLGVYSVGTAQTLANVQTRVNDAVTNGTVCILLFHGVDETGSDPSFWTTANFQALIDWLVAQALPCLTIEQVYALFP